MHTKAISTYYFLSLSCFCLIHVYACSSSNHTQQEPETDKQDISHIHNPTSMMEDITQIDLPYNQSMASCYDLVKSETPELWQAFEDNVILQLDSTTSLLEQLTHVKESSEDTWTTFLSNDQERKSRVVISSWNCSLGDLVEAIIARALPALTEDQTEEGTESKTELLTSAQDFVKEAFPSVPNSLMINFKFQAALNNLSTH